MRFDAFSQRYDLVIAAFFQTGKEAKPMFGLQYDPKVIVVGVQHQMELELFKITLWNHRDGSAGRKCQLIFSETNKITVSHDGRVRDSGEKENGDKKEGASRCGV